MPDGSAPTIEHDARLPVTLLSGFLGSGKTTLLSNILKSKDHGLRCAVIVNDMGALNIDAALVKNHKLTRTEEKVVQMQNGCICCTLRADLLEQVADLAKQGCFDYLLIESSGISEPIQVAETFTTEFATALDPNATVEDIEKELPDDPAQTKEQKHHLASLIAAGGLNTVARLDTCISLVDCTTFFGDFETADFLSDRHQDVDPEDERNITDLLVDQIEFANVILLNKTDVVSKAQADKVEQVVRSLNHAAKIIRTRYSKIELSEILNTGLFDFEKAALGAGWLQSLREMSDWVDPKTGRVYKAPKPETEEYGVKSFVYQARRPFHPKRLWDMLKDAFCILQDQAEQEEGEDEDEDEDMEEDGEDAEVEDAEDDEEEETREAKLARMRKEKEELNLPARVAFKKTSPVWKGVLRSKGFIWLATRTEVNGEWSQAGVMCTISGGSRWLCTIPEDEWPAEDSDVVANMKLDFEGAWGDRRQEIVFIGQDIDEALLRKTLGDALLDDKEWAQWEKLMRSKKTDEEKVQKLYDIYDDGWEEWDDPSAGGEDEDEEHDHAHHGHSHTRQSKKQKVAHDQ